MLWTLLILMGSACSLFGSIDAARHPTGSMGFLIAAVCIGVISAVLNFWAWTRLADSVIHPWVQQFTIKKRERVLAAIYAAALLWVPIAGILSNTVTQAVLSVFRR
jgi:hypothetical protein